MMILLPYITLLAMQNILFRVWRHRYKHELCMH